MIFVLLKENNYMKRIVKINKVVKNFLSLLFSNFFGQILTFIATVYVARYFGPDNFGVINFSNAIITYFTALASFGLQTLGIIEIAKSKKNNEYSINLIISLRIFLAILSYFLIISFVLFIHKSQLYKLSILFYGLTIFPTAIYVDWIFNANEEMQYNSKSIIIKNLVYSIMVIVSILIFKIRNVYYIALFMFISTLISSIYLLRVVRKFYKIKLKFIFNMGEYKRLILLAWPFFFSGVFATINSNIATLMLGFMRSDYEIGIYNSVYKIVNVFIMIATLLFTPIYPLLIKYYNLKAIDKLNSLINNLRKIIYIFSIPLVFAAFILKREIINTIYGTKYYGAYGVFTILIIYVAVLYIREIYGYALSAWNLQKKYMNIVLISSAYNVISNVIFIRRFGIQGAAVNTLVSEIINLILMFRAGNSKVKIGYRSFFVIKILLCSILMSIVITLFKILTSNAIILSLIGICVYFVLLFISKVITISEIKNNLLVKED
ncbi:hypothetical protein NL50_12280 [Clostridium acetobutylicum]|nr:hypothetical protein NL50_12280 [Clostridium acetobutylicum]